MFGETFQNCTGTLEHLEKFLKHWGLSFGTFQSVPEHADLFGNMKSFQ